MSNQLLSLDQQTLGKMYRARQRPLCPCKTPGVEMYIAKIGDQYIVKRMPNSGALHSPECDSYEPPPELSGLGEVLGSAIRENTEDGLTDLRFGFSMAKIAGRQINNDSIRDDDSVKTDGTRLTLKSCLHYLWEEAGFNKWTPAMQGKRNWAVIRKHLLQAAETKRVKGSSLVDSLYLPEPFILEKKDEIHKRRMSQMARLRIGQSSARQLMLLIGEVKEFNPARIGQKMVIKHAPGFDFLLQEDLCDRLEKKYVTYLDLWKTFEETRLMVIATFGLNSANMPLVEEMTLMPVTDTWIPFETVHEKDLIKELVAHNRRFTKGLRYNMGSAQPMASLVLSDTLPTPTAMYITPTSTDEEYMANIDLLIAESQLASWIWNANELEIPELPPAAK